MGAMVAFFKEYSFVFGVAGLIVTVASLMYQHFDKREARLREQLNSAPHRDNLIARYDCTAAQGYYATIKRLLNWADGFYGKPLGLRALDRCITLAFVYPLFAALVGWVFWDVSAPGGLPLFAENMKLPHQLFVGLRPADLCRCNICDL